MPFINRTRELNLLNDLAHSQQAQLFIVYGRRRVGKTELLRQFSQNHPHLFFVATQNTDKNLLGTWSRLLWQYAHGEDLADFSFPTWEASLRFLATLSHTEPLVVVVDEFPYMVEANAALPSILQKVWDEVLRHSQLCLILCGSSIGMMEKHTLDYGSPLYGRRSGQLLLQPLDFAAARQFVPRYTSIEQVETYAVFGGLPAYLAQISPQQSLADNVISHILNPNRFLYEEPLFLLRTELREPRNYFAVLQAIAHGNTRPNAIAQASGVGDARIVSKYLHTLQDLQLIVRDVPVTETQPDKSRRGLYRLADEFLRFWFRFVAPHRSELEQGQAELLWQSRIASYLPEFVGPVFERVCQQFLWEAARKGHLPFMPQKIGRWWANQQELDLVGLNQNERAVFVGECKWRNRPVGVNVLNNLHKQTQLFLSQHPFETLHYALFSKAGFTTNLQVQEQHDPNLHLYDLEAIMGLVQ